MQIKEARGIYQSQIKSYSKTASELRQKQKELEEKIKETPNGKVVYENEAVSLELSLNAIEQKQNEYRDYMEKLMDKWTNVEMLISTGAADRFHERSCGGTDEDSRSGETAYERSKSPAGG